MNSLSAVEVLKPSSAVDAQGRRARKIDTSGVQRQVQKIVTKMLNADVDADQPLMEAGLDSLGALCANAQAHTLFVTTHG